jgi:hypothetical protein
MAAMSSPPRSDDLLTAVLDAHGGRDRWRATETIGARLKLGGPFWAPRGWPGGFDLTVTLAAHREHIEIDYGDRVATFDVAPERVTLRAADGALLETREDPRRSFPPTFDLDATRWDAVQVAYFHATANWNYLTEPWQFADPGVTAREIEPWDEDGATWRRLAVTFGPANANHNREQVFYFDAEDLLLRRMDYRPEITGRSPVAHYVHDHVTVDGLVFPTRRRVHLHDAAGVADRSFAVIEIDVADLAVAPAHPLSMTMPNEGAGR